MDGAVSDAGEGHIGDPADFIQDGDTFEYEDYDTGAKIDFVPSY